MRMVKKRTNNTMLTAKLLLTPSSSWAPNRWAVMMDRPEVNPMTNPRIKKEMLPVQPTAARAFTPMVRPTITVSAMLQKLLKNISHDQGE